jgi:hypothetical protein
VCCVIAHCEDLNLNLVILLIKVTSDAVCAEVQAGGSGRGVHCCLSFEVSFESTW